MQTQNVGIIGVGRGVIVHAPALAAVDGYSSTAPCSRRPYSVAAEGKRLRITDVSTGWQELVERDDQHVVSVATPGRAGGLIDCIALLLEKWRGAFEGAPTSAPTFADGLRTEKYRWESAS